MEHILTGRTRRVNGQITRIPAPTLAGRGGIDARARRNLLAGGAQAAAGCPATAGSEYTNIASRTGLLEQPPLAGLVPEMAGVVVQDRYPSNTATHFGLADDPDVQALLLQALREVGS